MNVVDSIETATREIAVAEQDALVDVARAIARGEEYDVHETARLLRDSGKTPAYLQNLVDQVKERIRLRACVDAQPALKSELETLKAEIEEKAARFSALQEAEQKLLRPLVARLTELENAIFTSTRAERRLHKFVVDSSLLRRREELAERRKGPHRMLQQLERDFRVDDDGSPAFVHAAAVAAVERARAVVADKEINGTVQTLTAANADLKAAESNLADKVAILDRLRARRAEVQAEVQALEVEANALWAEELEP